jgi:uncharacterized protein HemY
MRWFQALQSVRVRGRYENQRSAAQIGKGGFAMRRFVTIVVLLIVAFLLGFVPVWIKLRESSNRLSEATHELNLVRAQSALTSAVVDVQRGDYEPAREAISIFFSSLRAETDSEAASTLSLEQREAVQPLFDRRDQIITMLARSDPASLAQLTDLYVSYRTIMNP